MKITADSHTDHRLTPEHLAWLCERFADRTGFFIEEALLPGRLPSVEWCGLHGPKAGDAPVLEEEVTYVTRGERAGASRMCKCPPRPTRTITVIAGPHGDEPCILYTARPLWKVCRDGSQDHRDAKERSMSPNDLSAAQLLALAERHVRRFKRLLDPGFSAPESVRRDECEAYLALWTGLRDRLLSGHFVAFTPAIEAEIFDAINSGDDDDLFIK